MPKPVEINRRLVDVDGGLLSIFRFGPLVEMPVVVAVHGITGSSYSWTAVARALGGRVALVAPDIRGRGRSNNLPGPFATSSGYPSSASNPAIDGKSLARAARIDRCASVGTRTCLHAKVRCRRQTGNGAARVSIDAQRTFGGILAG